MHAVIPLTVAESKRLIGGLKTGTVFARMTVV